MNIPILLLGLLPVMLVTAAIFDLTSFTIPNFLSASMLALFVAFLLAMAIGGHPVGWSDLSMHLLAGALALAAGMLLFGLGWVGGGDAKLFAVICLWLGWDVMLQYTIVVSIFGGVLTVALLSFRKLPLPSFMAKQPWIWRLADRDSGVPYGIALAIAALDVLPETGIFRLAAMS